MSYGPRPRKIVKRKKTITEDSVFFQPGKSGNRGYKYLIPGEMYDLTQQPRKRRY